MYPKRWTDNYFSNECNLGLSKAILSNTSNLETDPLCPTGNCTFPVFSSLAICSSCVDIKNLLQQSSNCPNAGKTFQGGSLPYIVECIYFLPRRSADLNHAVHESPGGSWTVDNGDPVYLSWDLINETASWTWPSLKTKFLFASDSHGYGEIHLSNGEVIPNFLAALALIKLSPVTNSTVPGSLSTSDICALSVCTKEYNISMTYGIPRFEIVSTSYTNVTEQNVDSTSDFELNFERTMSNVLQAILEGEFDMNSGLSGDDDYPASSNMLLAGLNASPDIPKTMDRIAAALSNRLRDMSIHKVYGLSGSMELRVRVSWFWLSLPVLSIIFGTVLLISIIITTRKHKLPIWKTSELALLFHGLDFSTDDTFKTHKASEMEDIASALQVKLERNSKGVLKLERKLE